MSEVGNILEGITTPVIVLDDGLFILAANEPARRIFTDLQIGQVATQAISENNRFQRNLNRAIEGAEDGRFTISVEQDAGEEYRVQIRPVQLPDQKLGVSLTFEDRSRLRDVKNMRSEFVANVSHEIRSPLTAISGFVETLQGPAKDDAEAREVFLGLMAKEVTRMTNLVTDLLSLSQVEVKERRALKKTVDPRQVIDQSIEGVTHLAKSRGKDLKLDVPSDLPTLPGKHADLVQVLINLLENAINYSRENTEICLTARRMPTDLIIEIQDQGEGIPAQDIPRLTERFYRVEKSRSRNVGGTGLGLAIVKHILIRHRAQLEIESKQGVGSTFRVILPLT